jgi:TRAP-type C4-dicarboxylate transport system permease small subunit
MPLHNLSDKAKAIIVLVLDLICIGFIGFAKIYGWEIPTWAVITDMVALILLQVFGIEYIFPPLPKLRNLFKKKIK